MSTNHLNESDELLSTADVAVDTDSSEAVARDWAAENGVQRVGNAFVWTPEDVEDFIADLDEDEQSDDDEDADDADDADDD